MAAVKVEHIRLEAGHFQAHPVVLALLGQLFLVCLVDDLVRAVTGFLQQLVGITDDIITAEICTVQDLLRFLVCLTDDILTHPLGIDQRALEHIAVGLIIFHFLAELLVLGGQVGDLLAQRLGLVFALSQLFLHFIQKTVHLLGTVAAEVFLKLHRAHVLRGQHSGFLPYLHSSSILEIFNDQTVFLAFSGQCRQLKAALAAHCEHIVLVHRGMDTLGRQMVDLHPSGRDQLCRHSTAAPQHGSEHRVQPQG